MKSYVPSFRPFAYKPDEPTISTRMKHAMKAKKTRSTVVSLFSGCGGLDIGFRDAGFDLLYASDNDPAAVSCYSRNIDARIYLRDASSDIFHAEIDAIGSADVVLGGFPCQGFSKAGPKVRDDPRNTLYVEMKRAVDRLRPSIFIAENVDGMSQNFGGAFVDRICEDFRQIGYDVEHRIIQAADFGVPQYRRRIFFVGVRNDVKQSFPWPVATHTTGDRNGEFLVDRNDAPLFNQGLQNLPPARTIADALSDLLELHDGIPDHTVTDNYPKGHPHIFKAIGPGQKLCNVRHSDTSVYTWQIPKVFGKTTDRERLILQTISKHRRHKRYGSVPNGNPLSLDVIESLSGLNEIGPDIIKLVEKKYLKNVKGKFDLLGAMFCSGLFKRPAWNAPSPTVLTVFDNPRYFLHPLMDRPFSIRECARLQTFPDTFRFCESYSKSEIRSAYRLIGNAVPPLLARKLADSAGQVVNQSSASYYPSEDETADASTAA